MIKNFNLEVEKPILFSTEMVRAIIEGKKTHSRRVIKPQPPSTHEYNRVLKVGPWFHIEAEDHVVFPVKCPYGQPGDILWVRETWYYENHMYDQSEGDALYIYVYKADQPDYPVDIGVGKHGWRPSIHMPRIAARLFLKVKSVRVERLQDITEDDARAEGCDKLLMTTRSAKNNFMNFWNSLNGKRGYGWITNPWVWVVEFEKLSAHGHLLKSASKKTEKENSSPAN